MFRYILLLFDTDVIGGRTGNIRSIAFANILTIIPPSRASWLDGHVYVVWRFFIFVRLGFIWNGLSWCVAYTLLRQLSPFRCNSKSFKRISACFVRSGSRTNRLSCFGTFDLRRAQNGYYYNYYYYSTICSTSVLFFYLSPVVLGSIVPPCKWVGRERFYDGA